jgi:hypothetical protein
MSDHDLFESTDQRDSDTELMEACTCLAELKAALLSWEQLTEAPMPNNEPCARPPDGWDEGAIVLLIGLLPESERQALGDWLAQRPWQPLTQKQEDSDP